MDDDGDDDRARCARANPTRWGLSRTESDELLDLFATGWSELAAAFRTGARIAKRYDPSAHVVVDVDLMRRVVAARKRAIHELFRCASGPSTQRVMQSFGSENVTSDYDVSILGPGASDVSWQMFVQFARVYGSLPPSACDTNLYANGTYLADPDERAVPPPAGVTHLDLARAGGGGDDGGRFTFVPDDKDPENRERYTRACAAWATAKCLMGGFGEDDARTIVGDETVDGAIARLDAARAVLSAARAPIARAIARGVFGASWRERSSDDIETIAKYALQTLFGRRMEMAIYAAAPQGVGADAASVSVIDDVADAISDVNWLADDALPFADTLCAAMFFSVEAAFTQSTVNVVVLEMQGGRVSSLPESDYRCALLENFGELMVHSRGARDDMRVDAAAAVKLSKYVYRMAYSAWKAARSAEFAAAMAAIVPTIEADVLRGLRGDRVPRTSGAKTSAALALVCFDPGGDRAAYRSAAREVFASLWRERVPRRWLSIAALPSQPRPPPPPPPPTGMGGLVGGGAEGACPSTITTTVALTLVLLACVMGG